MEDLKRNKKVIILCILLVILTFLFLIFNMIKGKNNNNYVETDNYTFLKDYKSNEYFPVYVTDEDIVKKYLNEFKHNLLYDIEEAFNSLNLEYRSKKFKNLDGFKDYVKNNVSSSTISIEVDKYSKSRMNGYKFFYIIDKSGNKYIFKELSIMNYEVFLDENTVILK